MLFHHEYNQTAANKIMLDHVTFHVHNLAADEDTKYICHEIERYDVA